MSSTPSLYRHRVLPSQTKDVRADEKDVAAAVKGAATLCLGDTGQGVESLQRLLRGVGEYAGPIDGKFNAGTQAAVENLQAAKHLAVTGTADTGELKALERQQLNVKDHFQTWAREGQKGSDIKGAEQKLNALGFKTGAVDGAFDSHTLSALKAFRKSDPNVPDKGNALTPRVLNGLNADVRTVEADLKLAGENPGRIDGNFTSQTKAAVEKFQKQHHLGVTGVADAKTRAALVKDSRSGGMYPSGAKSSQFQRGYDESMWQTKAQFDSALDKKGTRFMGTKATEGTDWTDPTFKQRWSEMGKKLKPGSFDLRIAYHFLTPGNGRAQADHFLNTVGVHGKLKPGTRLALDWEGSALGSTQSLTDAAKRIHQVTGTWPMIYASASEVGRAKAAVPNAPIWDAHYPPSASDFKNPFVQTGGSGVDTDLFSGTELALERWAGWV